MRHGIMDVVASGIMGIFVNDRSWRPVCSVPLRGVTLANRIVMPAMGLAVCDDVRQTPNMQPITQGVPKGVRRLS